MRFSLLACGLLCAVLPVFAQKKNFTIAEATNGMGTTLATQSLKQLSFRPGTSQLYQVVKDSVSGDYLLVYTDVATGKGGQLSSLSKLNKMQSREKRTAMPQLSWVHTNGFIFQEGTNVFQGRLEGDSVYWNRWLEVGNGYENFTIDKNNSWAFTQGNNLFFQKNGTHSDWQITKDADPNIINGQSVHRNEFGIEGGIFLSPLGNKVAYYHMDQTMVEDYPVIDWSGVPAKNVNVKYPMAGRKSHQVQLRIYDPATKATVNVEFPNYRDAGNRLDPKSPFPDQDPHLQQHEWYLTSVTWSPDEKSIFIAILNREQNHLWLNQYDAATGAFIKTLFEETSDKYVEPEHPLTFLPGSNDQFIWWSERDGYQHLYLFGTDGKLIRQLTSGAYDVNELLAFNAKKKELLITSAKEDPREKHGYAVNWTTGKMRRLDGEPGTHNYLFSEDGRWAVDVFSATGVAKRTVLRSTDGKVTRTLLDSPNPLANYNRATIREVELKADDGTTLYGKLILPPGFDSTRRYPTITYLYNGPHVQLIKNAFPESGNLWYEYMAQRGYVVFSMDGRGSSNRGLAFEQAVFRRLGLHEMDDQLQGVSYLKALPYVDSTRMGVHGWSYGGFMTTSLMLRHPGVFAVGVAGGPVLDWSLYEIMYGERYMDTPQENPEGYAENNLISKVQNLKGKLLMIHGAQDATVVWQHSVDFVREAVSKGVQMDYFIYPGYEHNVRGKDRVHLMQKISDYFDLYLKP